MEDNPKFGILWYPGFTGLFYAEDDENNIVVGPYFEDPNEAKMIFDDHVSTWNEKFVKIVFVEDKDEYEFICYQDPQVSYSKANFGFYRSSMSQSGFYSRFKDRMIRGCKFVIFTKNNSNTAIPNTLDPPIKVANIQILKSDEVDPNTYEGIARTGCKAD